LFITICQGWKTINLCPLTELFKDHHSTFTILFFISYSYIEGDLCVILGQARYNLPRRPGSSLLLRESNLGFETTGWLNYFILYILDRYMSPFIFKITSHCFKL